MKSILLSLFLATIAWLALADTQKLVPNPINSDRPGQLSNRADGDLEAAETIWIGRPSHSGWGYGGHHGGGGGWHHNNRPSYYHGHNYGGHGHGWGNHYSNYKWPGKGWVLFG